MNARTAFQAKRILPRFNPCSSSSTGSDTVALDKPASACLMASGHARTTCASGTTSGSIGAAGSGATGSGAAAAGTAAGGAGAVNGWEGRIAGAGGGDGASVGAGPFNADGAGSGEAGLIGGSGSGEIGLIGAAGCAGAAGGAGAGAGFGALAGAEGAGARAVVVLIRSAVSGSPFGPKRPLTSSGTSTRLCAGRRGICSGFNWATISGNGNSTGVWS